YVPVRSVPDVPVRHSPEKLSPRHTFAPAIVPFMNKPGSLSLLHVPAMFWHTSAPISVPFMNSLSSVPACRS
ncbi:MAG: hypothetical protein WD672_07175, partial [Woeseia sp.]